MSCVGAWISSLGERAHEAVSAKWERYVLKTLVMKNVVFSRGMAGSMATKAARLAN